MTTSVCQWNNEGTAGSSLASFVSSLNPLTTVAAVSDFDRDVEQFACNACEAASTGHVHAADSGTCAWSSAARQALDHGLRRSANGLNLMEVTSKGAF